jgi:hypothetical protein
VGMRASDVVRGMDLLAARNDVDPSRIAVVGRAGAAVPALFAALFDQRIGRLVLDGMLVSYESVVNSRIHQGVAEQLIPSALKEFDLPDVVASLSPAKVAVYNGVNPLGQEVTAARLKQEYSRSSPEIAVRDRDTQPFVPIVERFLASNAK